jgi:hypothetical protein
VTLTSQPISKGTDADVARIVARDFPPEEVASAFHILHRYGSETWHVAVARVRLAALKLAGGRLDLLQKAIREASKDFRDVVGPAEYPSYEKLSPSQLLLVAAKEEAIADDWKQYTEWLKR